MTALIVPSVAVSSAASDAMTRRPTRPLCTRCHRYIVIDTDADDDLWAEVMGPMSGPGYICADCFARAADERMIEWVGRLRFRPLSMVSHAALLEIANREECA